MKKPFETVRVITLRANAEPEAVSAQLQKLGLWLEPLQSGSERGFLVLEHSLPVLPHEILEIPGVSQVFTRPSEHPLCDRQEPISINGFELGSAPCLIVGPCAVESKEQLERAAENIAAVKSLFSHDTAKFGQVILRGGAFKPRTSPYSFAGLGEKALSWLKEVGEKHQFAVVTEVVSELNVKLVADYADMLQIGARNMQNFALLRAAGKAGRPLLLKRLPGSKIEDWLLAAEHALCAGSPGVVFCERGQSGSDPHTRNLLDLAAVAVLKELYGLPVLVDPSHGVGRRDLIPKLCAAACAAGADGVMIEYHPTPETAQSDGAQSVTKEDLRKIVTALSRGWACAHD